jgi:hypothetical protein
MPVQILFQKGVGFYSFFLFSVLFLSYFSAYFPCFFPSFLPFFLLNRLKTAISWIPPAHQPRIHQ